MVDIGKPKILVIGLGWASVAFIQTIDTNKFDVEIFSLDGKFVYTPLLAQNIKEPKQLTLDGKDISSEVSFKSREIINVNFQSKEIHDNESKKHPYTHLIFSHGASVNTFNISGVQENCFFLKSDIHADELSNKIKSLAPGSHIAVIGCGLTGSELVGSLLDMHKFHIHAIDALPRPLTMFDERWSKFTLNVWKEHNISTYMNHMVASIDKNKIHFKEKESLAYDIAIWCGGIKKSPLTEIVLSALNMQHNRGIPVNEYLQVEGCQDVHAMGDCAFSGHPPTAQVAFQQGKYLAHMFNNNFQHRKKFEFNNQGQIGYIGDHKSVCQLPYFQSGGNIAYYLNNCVHVYNAVNWRQRWNMLFS